MLEPSQIEHLKRALHSNKVMLFLGAGFSCEASNLTDSKLPTGKQLSKILWEFCYGSETYEDIDLQTIFEASLKSGKSINELHNIMQENLTCRSIPEWYKVISSQYWYRIYTTNIDDLIEKIYKKSILPLSIEKFIAPRDDFSERDQFLSKIQYIKLNGSIELKPETYTFSTRQFAQRATEFDIWYDHFMRDYMTYVTIFIGTELNEPLFWRHIELREARLL